jgi:hypothetical protein
MMVWYPWEMRKKRKKTSSSFLMDTRPSYNQVCYSFTQDSFLFGHTFSLAVLKRGQCQTKDSSVPACEPISGKYSVIVCFWGVYFRYLLNVVLHVYDSYYGRTQLDTLYITVSICEAYTLTISVSE